MNVKVLLVDDEKEFADTLGERLRARGFDVQTASSGDEGLALLKEEPVDVVILDVLMPGKTGVEVLGEIKLLNPIVEVIMLTGHGTIETAIEGLKLGAYDYLLKPTDIGELMAKIIRAYARKSEQEDRIRRAEIAHIVATKGW